MNLRAVLYSLATLRGPFEQPDRETCRLEEKMLWMGVET